MPAIHKTSIRKALRPRREPYWSRIRRGLYLGFRKIDGDSGAWVARVQHADRSKNYRSLGYVSDTLDFDAAKAAAESWFKMRESGVTDEVVTVEQACAEYVNDRRREKGEACAHDAMKRFERCVFGTPFGRRPLDKLGTEHIKQWREGLGLSPAASNRTLTTLKAALNLCVQNRRVDAARAIEWRSVRPLKGSDNRRTIFLDVEQRRALLAACGSAAVRDLVEGALLTGARPGELVNAVRGQYDAKQKTMMFCGKTGRRVVALSAQANALFAKLARSKLPNAYLFVRDDGSRWPHSGWDKYIKQAAREAGLPAETCLYVCRHTYIGQAIADGMNTLEIARQCGTSLAMVDRHYGSVALASVRERLDKVKMF
jgi:integrase